MKLWGVMKKFLLVFFLTIIGAALAVAAVVNPFGQSPLNDYQKEGVLILPGLKSSCAVHRDENGMAYVYVQNLEDAFFAQGFVTAQDRLFQMELNRLFSSGRLSELAGEAGLESDIKMRTLGFRREAKKHLAILGPEARNMLERYAEGVNAFIQARPDDIPLEFKLAGLAPSAWTPVDSLTILYFMGWGSSANMLDEIIAMNLADKLGPVKAWELRPININPEINRPALNNGFIPGPAEWFSLGADSSLLSFLRQTPPSIGSNSWSIGPQKSANRRPITANDPHLDARILPGPWYPCGLIGPGLRAVGAGVPGIPGMIPGRTEHLAAGVTNSYGDAQDLYIETIDPADPGRYMEGEKSLPFELVEDIIKIRDKDEPEGFREKRVITRLTRRGPVVSGVASGLEGDRLVTVRWSGFEGMGPSLGLETMLFAKNIQDARESLRQVTTIALNFLLADDDGNIGWQTSGRLPIRSQGESLFPYEVKNSEDNWTGWIPWDEMPSSINPGKGWIGSCNHLAAPEYYPYYYSTHLSPSFRQRRLMELLDAPGRTSADDQWNFQRDATNVMARLIAPLMGDALKKHSDTIEMARVLSEWDYTDQPRLAGPAVFQTVYHEFARLVFEDDLGEKLAEMMLDNWYFWQERLLNMVLKNDSPWFDDVRTPDRVESRDDLFRQAALRVMKKPMFKKASNSWSWGKIHRHEFITPLFRKGLLKKLFRGGDFPAPGSGETLYRGYYLYNDPYNVKISASLRLVVDLGDPDKITAVLPGGVSGRLFDPHMTDQLDSFMNGDKVYWYFSDEAIKKHTETTLRLKPAGG